MDIIDVPFNSSLGIPKISDDIKQRVRNGENIKINISCGSGFVKNALKWGVAGLNIEGCRIGIEKADINLRPNSPNHNFNHDNGMFALHKKHGDRATQDMGFHSSSGRFPSNLLLSHHPDCVCEGSSEIKTDSCKVTSVGLGSDNNHPDGVYAPKNSKITSAYADSEGKETIEKWTCSPDCIIGQMNERVGIKKSGSGFKATGSDFFGLKTDPNIKHCEASSGYVSRYFKQFAFDPERLIYSGKASKAERNAGCEGIEKKNYAWHGEGFKSESMIKNNGRNPNNTCPPVQNNHPCVKPQSVLSYLCRLTATPDGGIVFDPFMGSGSTGVAAIGAGRQFIGIEKELEYCAISKARIIVVSEQTKQETLFKEFKELPN